MRPGAWESHISRPRASSMSWSYGKVSPAATIFPINDQIAGQSPALASLINTPRGSVPATGPIDPLDRLHETQDAFYGGGSVDNRPAAIDAMASMARR
jgi:hypothetical protein